MLADSQAVRQADDSRLLRALSVVPIPDGWLPLADWVRGDLVVDDCWAGAEELPPEADYLPPAGCPDVAQADWTAYWSLS